MKNSTENAFRSWHLTANNYDEFLNQRIHSALAVELCSLPVESVRMLPERGIVVFSPHMLADGFTEPPALMIGIIGIDDERLKGKADGFEVFEIRPFGGVREFLGFEQTFLDLECESELTWDTLDSDARLVAAISYLGLMKPVDLMFGGTSMAASLVAANDMHHLND